MTWRDNLQDASFRGINFKVEKHTVSGGRRIKRTERWQKRTITTDMGPEENKFSISAYVIQNADNGFDYFENRDKLINALQNNTDKDKYNVGTLVHPYFGKRKVHPESYSLTEDYREGGIARIDITFILEEDELFPGTITKPAARMDAIALKANNISLDSFTRMMNTAANFVEDVGDAAIGMMMKVQQAVNSVNNAIKSTIATATGICAAAINTINSVLNAPCELYNTIKSVGESFKYICGMAGTVVQGGILGGCSGTVYGTQTTLDGSSIPEALGASVVDQLIASQEADEDSLNSVAAEQADNLAIVINANKFTTSDFLIFHLSNEPREKSTS